MFIYDILGLVQNIYTEVSEIAWAVFLLAWGVGWAVRGSPIPVFRIKKGGQDIIEDAVIAALAVAVASSVFAFIHYLAGNI